MGLLEKLPYQQALVIALDDFGRQVAREAERLVRDFDASVRSQLRLETGAEEATIASTIGWIRVAPGEEGKWRGAPLSQEMQDKPLAEVVGPVFRGLAPAWWNDVEVPEGKVTVYPIFLVHCLETAADARALLEVGRACQSYAAAHPEIEESHVYGFCYAPTHRESGERALAERRSRVLHDLAEALGEPTSSCDHILLFEDITPTASAAATPDEMKSRLANLLFLLLTSRPLAEHYNQLAQRYDCRERGQFFSTLGACSLVFPASGMVERVGLQLAHDYLDRWVFPEEENAEAFEAVDVTLRRLQEILDPLQWQQEILERSAGTFPARLEGSGAEPCLKLDVRTLFGGARLEEIREKISPPNDPAKWAMSLDETDAVISLWLPRYEAAVIEAFQGRGGHPEEGWDSQVEERFCAEFEGLLRRDADPPVALGGIRQFLGKARNQLQLQRQSLSRHSHQPVNLRSRYQTLAEATRGLPSRGAIYARLFLGTALAAVFFWVALQVEELPNCPGVTPFIFLDQSLRSCMPFQETVRIAFYVISSASLAITWGGVWLWHRRLLLIAKEAWEDYWFALEQKYSYLLHGKMVDRMILLLNRLEQGIVPRLEESLEALEKSLRQVYLDHPLLPVDRMIEPSLFGLSLLDSGIYDQLFRSHISSFDSSEAGKSRVGRTEINGHPSPAQSAPSGDQYHAILRNLATGEDLFPHDFNLEAPKVNWQHLWEKSYSYAAAKLLSLTAGQVLSDYYGPTLERFLPSLPAEQRSFSGLLRFLARRATPLSSLRDAREDPGRLGRPRALLLFSEANRLARLQGQSSDFEVREVADPHRISVVLLVEPFSLRALASVFPREKSYPEQAPEQGEG